MSLLDKAITMANQARDRAKDKAEPLLEQAGPLTEKAGGMAAKGLTTAAERIDKATGGKYHDQINSVSEKVGGLLDQGKRPPQS